jgi:hypothetical protein
MDSFISQPFTKEINMSKKTLLKVVVAFGLLAIVLITLAVIYVPSGLTQPSTERDAVSITAEAESEDVEVLPTPTEVDPWIFYHGEWRRASSIGHNFGVP